MLNFDLLLFKFLSSQSKGSLGEVQITDAINAMIKVEKVFGCKFKGKYFILGAIWILGLIFTTGILQIIFGIYTLGCVIGAIKGDN